MKVMRIKIQQFLFGKLHSWSCIGQNLGRSFIKLGHDVEFISTDGFEQRFVPTDLVPFIKKDPVGEYDCQISYTAPHNWPKYLRNGTKNRFGIWNYEYNNKNSTVPTLLQGFSKFYKATDLVLPSSNFSKEVFISMGIPNDKMVVIPHGINLQDFEKNDVFKLATSKKRKILLNIAQPHRRKALHLALKSFGKAFTKEDDVCLVAKIFKQNKTDHPFDIDFDNIYKTFESKFPRHAEVEFVYSYIPNIADLYKSCDINFSATHAECWHLPSLEALASGTINVVPRYGGQLDFCNDNNSLLIDGSIVRAPRDHQYWSSNPFAVHFEIDTDDGARKLQMAVDEFDSLKASFAPYMAETASQFTWENAAKKIIDMCR
jgi:glycosyltransferase involved in cell wall biosynthesis